MGDDEEAWADPFAVVLFDRLAGFLVVTDGARERAVRVPGGEWIVLATGERLTGPLSTSLPAPLGAPPCAVSPASSGTQSSTVTTHKPLF